MTASDFVLGVTHSAAVLNGGRLGINADAYKETHAAYASVFSQLEDMADDEGLKLHFRIRPHKIHGDSQTLESEFSRLIGTQLLESWTRDPILTYDSENLGETLTPTLPGSPEMYNTLGLSLLRELGLAPPAAEAK